MIADEIIAIVAEEVDKIKKGNRSPEALMKLEKLSKVYTAVMACNRENIKSGLLGQLRDEDLVQSGDSTGESYEGGDGDSD